MLIKCPECELQVSDKAIICPHCGYPLKPDRVRKVQARKTKRRQRLPNGFGQISEIKNRNLRKPFRAMITVGFNSDTGRPICKPLKPVSYFETYNDAYAALVEYHRNPYDLKDDITFKELFDIWMEKRYSKKGYASQTTMKGAWKFCSSIYNMKVSDIRTRHLKDCIENGVRADGKESTNSHKRAIKTLFNMLCDYAIEYEIMDRNYARNFKLDPEIIKIDTKNPHIAYTDEEIKKLWDALYEIEGVDFILIQCYSGWRPNELLDMTLDDVNLEESYFVGGLKTESGRNRKVPIHSKIQPIVATKYKEAVDLGFNHLFITKKRGIHDVELNYRSLLKSINNMASELGLNPEHRPHDGRKYFITKAKESNVDEYAIKYLVGHVINDITEKVYTERQFGWLKEEIEKIK